MTSQAKVYVFLWCALALLFGVLLNCSGCGASMPPVPPELRNTPAQASAAVLISRSCNMVDPFEQWGDNLKLMPDALGSGVIVDERHVLTAYHVVECPVIPAVVIQLEDGRTRHVFVQREERTGDLALLTLVSAQDFDLGLTRPIITPAPPVGEPVCAAVASPAREWNCGNVTAHDDTPANDIAHDAQTRHGNSGAGVYDSHGDLVGIVTELQMCADGTEFCGGHFTSLWQYRSIVR